MNILLFTSQDISQKMTEFFFKRKDVELTVVTQVTLRDKMYGYKSTVAYCKKEASPVGCLKK